MAHLISNIHVQNFRSIINHEFTLSSFTPLVGYNNAGKSNIINAIKWVIEKKRLINSDFNNVEKPVIVTATIEGVTTGLLEKLNKKHKDKIEKFIKDDLIKIRRIQSEPNASTKDIKLEVFDPFEESDEKWKPNPAGIDNAISALFPEPIHIGAMENAEEDVSKNKSTTTIGRLLSEVINPIERIYGDQVKEALKEIGDIFDSDSENRADELIKFDSDIKEKLDVFFPDIEIKAHIPSPELKEIFSKGTIKVYENSRSKGQDVSTLGHGAQRSIQMALVRHLADIKQENNEGVGKTLLLIDEPELYLHPQAIEVLRSALKILSTQGYQIVFSTHSPFMITKDDIGNTILVRKNEDLGTHKRVTLKSAIVEIERNSTHQLALLFELSNSSNILFSERVVLVEGKTENNLLPFLVENITKKTLGLNKTALVKLDGSGNIKKAMDVLNMMDIPCKAIVDFDYAFKQAVIDKVLDNDNIDLEKCKAKLTKIATDKDITLVNGLPTKRNNSLTSEEVFALLAKESNIQGNISNLKEKLLNENYWIWTKGAIENHLNISEKKEHVWAELIEKIEKDSIEIVLPNDFEMINNCVNWILN